MVVIESDIQSHWQRGSAGVGYIVFLLREITKQYDGISWLHTLFKAK